MVITYDFLGKYGQLGNQMFQYALLIGIKYKLKYDILIDPEVKNTSYLFDFFDLKEAIIREFHTDNLFNETNYHYNSNVFEIMEDTNFRGYYQSEKYFKHCENIVRNEFTFKSDISDRVNKFIKPFEGKRLVSVHVRRGDYLIHNNAHPLCSLDYYNQAMDMLDGEDVVFICVSDDKEWCEKNIKKNNIIFNKSDTAHDMCLISKCNDHIIANSTFSWWGAWLGLDINKIVIYPNKWFGSFYKDFKTIDLFPDDWIGLDENIFNK